LVLQPADEWARSLHQENRLFKKSQQQDSPERVAEARMVTGVQVPTPTVQEFQSVRLLEANKAVAKADGAKNDLESAKSPNSWHDAPCRKSSLSTLARTSSNQSTQPRLGLRSVTSVKSPTSWDDAPCRKPSMSTKARTSSSNQSTQPGQGVRTASLDFGLSARAVQEGMRPRFDRSVPDPPLACQRASTASNAPVFPFPVAQLTRSKTAHLGRQISAQSENGGETPCDAEWSWMAKRIQHQWTDVNAEKRLRVFESAKLEDKLANYFQQQLIKERTGEGAVSPQQRPVQRGCGQIAIVDKALEIRLAQQRLKAEGQAVR